MTTPGPDPEFETLLAFVRDARGFDYTGYKRPTLMRRVGKRMQAVGVSGWAGYTTYLEDHPDEFEELFDAILINVTGFFRDKEAWQLVAEDVIPRIVEQKGHRASIRIWSAGCASGEEAYTIAMLFAEALGEDEFKERVKIYATDVDDQALRQGRHAEYSEKQLSGVPEELRGRYFTSSNHVSNLRNDIRRTVIFGRNDLLQDPPISRVDLLVARNTLMYFGAPAQERILANFYWALGRRGFLMLGKAEALQSRTDLFRPYNLKRRVFVRNMEAGLGPGLGGRPAQPEESRGSLTTGSAAAPAFEQALLAQVLVDGAGTVAAINQAARDMFGLESRDVGRPLRDLELSYRPVELRSLVEQVQIENRAVSSKEVEWSVPGESARYLDFQLAPLTSGDGELLGVSITFTDVTHYRNLHEELEQTRRQLEIAFEELQSTVEELETTNEELQSTNEELETTNEELQSTNEELETMNEELQSTNEELETMNDQLRDRTDEAMQASAFLGSILSGVHQSVVVVDPELRVRAWSRATAELWGLRADEVEGEHFLDLGIGLPVQELRKPIRRVLAGGESEAVTLAGHNRRGQPIDCTISFAQLRGHDDGVEGAILVVSAELGAGEGSR